METRILIVDDDPFICRQLEELYCSQQYAVSTAPNATDLKLILWDLAQQEYLNESSKLAQNIQEEMNRISGVTNRGVKQAPFKVLVGATMPAALVEVAFITNPDEEARIQSEPFQKTVVEALTTAIARYKTDYETRIGVVKTSPVPTPPPTSSATTTPARTKSE